MITIRSKHNNPHHKTLRSSIFLPKICSASSSVNDVIVMSRCRRSSEEDPSSPTVGCMGQVKRTNKVVAFPVPSVLLFKHFVPEGDQTRNKHHRSKLKRLFSFKSVTNTAVTRKPGVAKKMGNERSKGSLVNLEELDPPLPVVKKAREEKEEESERNMSLWKRRSGGAPLKTLRVQVTRPNCSL